MKYKVLAVSVLIAIFLLFSIASPTYTGRVVDTLNTEYLLNNLEEVKEDYNANIERVPKFFKSIFGNEVIRLNIARRDGTTKILFIKTEGGMIKYINESISDKATLLIWTDEETIDTVSNSNDQVRVIKKALENDDIRYKAEKAKTKMKTFFAKASFKVWSLFN